LTLDKIGVACLKSGTREVGNTATGNAGRLSEERGCTQETMDSSTFDNEFLLVLDPW